MGEDELATIETLTSYKETMKTLIRQYKGRVVDSTGDNLLAEFSSVADAVQCAVEVQQIISSKNEPLPENRRMYFRICINSGDVIEEGDLIYEDGVNIAARVESLAEGGGISISGAAYDQLGKKLPLGYEYLGEQSVKSHFEIDFTRKSEFLSFKAYQICPKIGVLRILKILSQKDKVLYL